MSKYVKWYQGHLARTPIATQLLTTGILFGTGDVLAQQVIERAAHHHDFARTARMAFFGAAMAGPVFIGWYRFLDRYVTFPTSNNKTLLSRVVLDQLLFAPVNIAYFYTAQGVLERKTSAEISNKLSASWGSTVLDNWKLWPAVQLLNFKFVPLEHRLLVVNLVSLGWNCVLSAKNAAGGGKTSQIIQVD